jgi:hypothetical protein
VNSTDGANGLYATAGGDAITLTGRNLGTRAAVLCGFVRVEINGRECQSLTWVSHF